MFFASYTKKCLSTCDSSVPKISAVLFAGISIVGERITRVVLSYHLYLSRKRPFTEESSKSQLDETAMDPPKSRLEITIEPLQSWWHWHDSDTKHLRPAQLLIENADGQPISVRQFIQAVHAYALPLRKLLLRCMDVTDLLNQQRARFFFDMITGGSVGEVSGQQGFAVNVVEDPAGDGEKCAWIWENVETRVKKQSASQ